MAVKETREIVLDALTKYKARELAFNDARYQKQVSGKGLSTNDYTTVEKDKLSGVAAGAQVNTIEMVLINGVAVPVDSKAVNLDLSDYVRGADVASALIYKGSVADFASLPISNLKTGYVYNIVSAGGTDANGTAVKAGDNVAYNGAGWDILAGTQDLSSYVTQTNLTATLGGYVTKVTGKDLSTNDFSDYYKGQVDELINATSAYVTDAEIEALFV